jgi:putative transposase
VSGRKRHLLVDTTGLVLKALVHPADVTDRAGGQQLLASLADQCPRLAKLWVDAAYQGTFVSWVTATPGWAVEIVRKPWRWIWWPADSAPPPMSTGFQVLPRRWVVERTFAWLGRHRRLSKDYEALAETEEAGIYLAMTRLMVARLAR